VGRIRVGAGERGGVFLWLRVTCISFVNATVSPDQWVVGGNENFPAINTTA